MPHSQVWKQGYRWHNSHRDIMGRLGLPCKLRCSDEYSVGGHTFEDDGKCYISVNPTIAFPQPAHLILHEAAHHIFLLPYQVVEADINRLETFAICCGEEWGNTGGHCPHWAETLLGLYEKLNIPLPLGTQFPSFAKIAGIQLDTREDAIHVSQNVVS